MRRLDINCFAEMSVFVKVVERGGYSAAARACAITPSAVSKLMTRLESRLGARLLNRSTRKQLLTPEGMAFYERSVAILADLDEAEREASASSAPQGVVRISCNVGIGRQLFLPIINLFMNQHPGVSVELFLTDEVVDLIEARADIAIRTGALKNSNLVAKRLGQSRGLIVGSPDYLAAKGTPLVPQDLADHNCLGFTFSPPAMEWALLDESGEQRMYPVKGNLRVSDGDALRELTVLGAGLAKLGFCQVADDLAAGRLVCVLQPFVPASVTEIHAIYVGQGGHLPARVRALMDFLATHLHVH